MSGDDGWLRIGGRVEGKRKPCGWKLRSVTDKLAEGLRVSEPERKWGIIEGLTPGDM